MARGWYTPARVRPFLLVSLLLSSSALAASISGQVTSGGSGLGAMEVRLWAQTPKGYSFTSANGRLVVTDAAGNYAISGIPAGTYKLDTRMGSAVVGNFGDRWFDVAAPNGNGYVEEDADELVLGAADARTGVNIAVEANGALTGQTVSAPTTPIGGLFVRLESVTDLRLHHNDVAKTTPATRLGELVLRGLPPGSYRAHVHDPNYVRADTVAGPISVVANSTAVLPAVNVPLAPVDPGEPNNTAATGTALNPAPLRQMPTQPLTRTGAIGPRNSGDVDFFCWSALENERYFLRAVSNFGALPDGGVRESPWVDPVLSFWRGGMRVAQDDDSGPLGRDARLDTGVVAAGTVCAAVSTFGDTAWNGMNQGSAGPYTLTVSMGNRPPTITANALGSPTPTPPATVVVNEGALITVDVGFVDPEGDPIVASWELRDSLNQQVSSGSFAGATGMVTFSPSNTAARRSPYTLTLRAADPEFTSTKTVLLEVRATNIPPGLPEMLSPDAGGVVSSARVALVCREAPDDDGDPLAYQFELSWVDGGQVLESGSVAGNDAGIDPDGGTYGLITYTTASLPENARLQWRVRAFDGNLLNGYSPWSMPWSFVVDVINEPPPRPVLVKPVDQEMVMLTRPTLELTNAPDPEGDAVLYVFEIARDPGFSQVVALSPQVPQTIGSTTTAWTSNVDLSWGSQYYARATAIDARGARSPPGPSIVFSIRGNLPPMTATPGAPFAMGLCSDQVFTTPPTSVAIPAINDVEQDAIIVEVQVTTAADSTFMTPLFAADVMANPMMVTSVSLESVMFQEDQKYLIRMRSKDGVNITEWVECSFTLDARSGGGGDGGPVSITTKPGCGCTSADWLSVLGVVVPLLRRRAHRSARSSP